jgi:hypothetical protein
MPPEFELDPAAALPTLLPEEKGLLNELPVEPKLKLAPPEALFEAEPAPKLGVPLVGAAEAPPKIGAADVLDVFPKPKMGGAEAVALVLPPLKALFAGDGPSCFIGLPSNMGVDELGDLGAANMGFGACVVPLEPKLNDVEAAGAASVLGVSELEAPKRGLAAGVDEPKRLLVAVVVAGLAPNMFVEVAGVVVPEAGVLEVPNSELGALGASAGFPPKRVDDCNTGVDDSAGLLAEANRLVLAGADRAGLSTAVEVPNKDFAGSAGLPLALISADSAGLSSGLGAPNSFAGSAALGTSADGFSGLSADVLVCKAGAFVSKRDFLGASSFSFSLSDSLPDLSLSETVVSTEDSFSAGLSCLAPNRLEEVEGLAPKMLLEGADVELPNSEVDWGAEVVGANLRGVLLGFQV